MYMILKELSKCCQMNANDTYSKCVVVSLVRLLTGLYVEYEQKA